MNVELVTDGRRPRLLWRGTLRRFFDMHLAGPEQHATILAAMERGDEVAVHADDRRSWLRRDLGEALPAGEPLEERA